MAKNDPSQPCLPRQPSHRGGFEIGLICALPKESSAVAAVFDGNWEDCGKVPGDENSYKTGWIGRHNVVLTYLPNMGKVAAAHAAAQLRSSYPKIRMCLVVGICGGVPTQTATGDIRLGDVLISTGLKQYDFGRIYPDGLKRKDTHDDNLGRPNSEIRSFLHKLQEADTKSSMMIEAFGSLEGEFKGLSRPGDHQDRLFPSHYRHKHQNPKACRICAQCKKPGDAVCRLALESTCAELGCNQFTTRARPTRRCMKDAPTPFLVHFGYFASGDAVMKSGLDRDHIAQEEGIIGFEMEGAGVWDTLPTVIVKAVCDYADSHKDKIWQDYAAAVAASCMKSLLNRWSFTYDPAMPLIYLSPERALKISKVSDTPKAYVLNWKHVLNGKLECLRALAFPEMSTRRSRMRDAASRTYTWLKEHPSYRSWLRQRRGILWIKGKPGAGKSTLMNYAFESSERNGQLLASFFFDGTGVSLQKSQIGLFRSLLHQILCRVPPLLELFASEFSHRWTTLGDPGNDWNWELKELQSFLKHTIMSFSNAPPIRIFVDALDESGEDNAVQISSFFEDIASSCNPDLISPSICFSCRHYPNIRIYQDDDLIITLENENYNDIEIYVKDTLTSKRALKDEEDTQRLVSQIAKGASGVFQWVVLVVDDVLKQSRYKRPIDVLSEKIRETPPSLHQLYETTLLSISQEDRPQSVKLLQWVCFATRPLSPGELRWAMALDATTACDSLHEFTLSRRLLDLDETEEEIKRLSGGLIEVRDQDQKGEKQIGFIHQSVYDYMTLSGLQYLSDASNISKDAHFRLSRVCLRIIASKEVVELAKKQDRPPKGFDSWTSFAEAAFPFVRYAASYWNHHTKMVEAAGVYQDDLLDIFQWPSHDALAALTRLQPAMRVAEGSSADDLFTNSNFMHYASYHGLLSMMKAILQALSELESCSKSTESERFGHNVGDDEHERISLRKADYINQEDLNNYAPLSMAAKRGCTAIVEELLATGLVDIDLNSRRDGRTPLCHAVAGGNLDIVRLLLATGQVNPDFESSPYGETPLFQAAEAGLKDIAQALLDTGRVDVNSKTGFGQTPLSRAAENGHLEVVELLLLSDQLDPNAAAFFGATPLSMAAERGHANVVSRLLSTGKVEVNSTDKDGRTALSYAAKEGHVNVVETLLSASEVIVDSRDNLNRTALSYAAEGGHVKIVQLLLATKKVVVQFRDKAGQTPFSYALLHEDDQVSNMLLSVMTEQLQAITKTDDESIQSLRSKILCSSELDHLDMEAMVEELLARNQIDDNATDSSGRNLLSWAAEWGFKNIVQDLLLSNDPQLDFNCSDSSGRSVLTWAAVWGWNKVARDVLKKGVTGVASRDNLGQTPADVARVYGHKRLADIIEGRKDQQ